MQKENKETIHKVCAEIFEEKKELDGYTYRNEEFGVDIGFKTFFTMVDGGLVSKYFEEHASKCRVCVYPMLKFRKEQEKAEQEGKLDEFLLNLFIQPGSLDFGGSPTHTKLHIAELLLDLGARQFIKVYGKKGYADLKNQGEEYVHDAMYKLLGIRVNEAKAGKVNSFNFHHYRK